MQLFLVKSQHRTIVDLDSLPAGFDYADPMIGWAELRDRLNDVRKYQKARAAGILPGFLIRRRFRGEQQGTDVLITSYCTSNQQANSQWNKFGCCADRSDSLAPAVRSQFASKAVTWRGCSVEQIWQAKAGCFRLPDDWFGSLACRRGPHCSRGY